MTEFKQLDSILDAYKKNQEMVDELIERVNALIEKVEESITMNE